MTVRAAPPGARRRYRGGVLSAAMPHLPPATAAERLSRIRDFEHGFARRQADRVLPVPGGFAVRNDRFTGSYEHNRLIVSADPPAGTVPANNRPARNRQAGSGLADIVLTDAQASLADLGYHSVSVDGTPDTASAERLIEAGYRESVEVLMAFTGPAPEAGDLVAAVAMDTLRAAVIDSWRAELPGRDERVYQQLADRRQARLRGVDAATGGRVEFLAVLDPDGHPRAWCDLYLSPAEGVAQVEDVLTLPPWRGRGYASALVHTGVRRALRADCGLVFLRADADDWPVRLYRRLGFGQVGFAHGYVRALADPARDVEQTS